jgi:hypothetical protein
VTAAAAHAAQGRSVALRGPRGVGKTRVVAAVAEAYPGPVVTVDGVGDPRRVPFGGLRTSLPELATAVQAARKAETDLVVGNLLGSNLFNAAGVGATAAFAGYEVEDIPANADGRVDFDALEVRAGDRTLPLTLMEAKTLPPLDIARAEIRRHDNDRVREINLFAATVGDPAFVKGLEENVHQIR